MDSPEDSTVVAFPIAFPAAGLGDVHLLRLRLTDAGGKLISSNFYLRPKRERDFRALRTLAAPTVASQTKAVRDGERWLLTTELRNGGNTPALMIRLQAVRAQSRDRILPAIFSDNYLALLPGESATITTELRHADTRGEEPAVVVSGYGLKAQ